jgi:hypothetical protein
MTTDPMKCQEQNAIRVWMRQVMQDREWSANHWATLAGTSPTNITRFLNEGTFTPSSTTIAKLVHAAGSQPNFSSTHNLMMQKVRQIVLYNEANQKIDVIGVYGMNGDLKAFKSCFTYTSLGIVPSDIIVVKPNDINSSIQGQKYLCSNDKLINCIYESTNDKSLLINKETGDIAKRKDLTIVGRIAQVIKNLDD